MGRLAFQLTWTLAIYCDELFNGSLEDACIRNMGTLKKKFLVTKMSYTEGKVAVLLKRKKSPCRNKALGWH